MLSTAQLLAVKPPVPSVPFIQFPCRWDHYLGQHHSDPHSSTFHGILLSTLCDVSLSRTMLFQRFIRSMPHRFHPTGTIAFDFGGDSVKSEADVATYLQSQVLNPTWQAVLAMLPNERDYELMATKPFETDVCVCLFQHFLIARLTSCNRVYRIKCWSEILLTKMVRPALRSLLLSFSKAQDLSAGYFP